jgi:hypothetical protein
MTLVHHVFPNGIQAPEFPAFLVAEDADVANCDLLTQICDETWKVDEIFGIGDEKRMGVGHMGEVGFDRGRLLSAEET